MFCAAIPATLAVGANAHARQKQQAKPVDEAGQEPVKIRLPSGPLTLTAVAVLLVCSVVYHSQS
jgi:hypothetical protein